MVINFFPAVPERQVEESHQAADVSLKAPTIRFMSAYNEADRMKLRYLAQCNQDSHFMQLVQRRHAISITLLIGI
jgi:cellobiose-specific phosphotransferase system component IIB